MQCNRPLPDDGGEDIASYNAELARLGPETRWFGSPWLYTECYLYRRIQTIFSLSKHWKGYDVFARQKLETFRSSRPAVLELAARYRELTMQLADAGGKEGGGELLVAHSEDAQRLLFREMCEVCLWGNATDLSLLTSLTYDDIQALQGAEARKKSSEEHILIDDLDAAYAALSAARSKGGAVRRVDFVLDNAGFELFVDLVLAGYLLTSGLATEVVLHAKVMPWFVSDVVPKDFDELLNALADPARFYGTAENNTGPSKPLTADEEEVLKFLFDHWGGLKDTGRLELRANSFWTLPGSYWRMPGEAPMLFEELRRSELVVFKGDLNYRKLTGDVSAPLICGVPRPTMSTRGAVRMLISHFDVSRQCGSQQRPSLRPSARLGRDPASTCLRCVPARPT